MQPVDKRRAHWSDSSTTTLRLSETNAPVSVFRMQEENTDVWPTARPGVRAAEPALREMGPSAAYSKSSGDSPRQRPLRNNDQAHTFTEVLLPLKLKLTSLHLRKVRSRDARTHSSAQPLGYLGTGWSFGQDTVGSQRRSVPLLYLYPLIHVN